MSIKLHSGTDLAQRWQPDTLIHYRADSALYWAFSVLTIHYPWMNTCGSQAVNILQLKVFPKDILRDILNVLGGLTRSHSAHTLSLPIYVFSPLPDVVSCILGTGIQQPQEALDMCHFNTPAAFSTMRALPAHLAVNFQMHLKNPPMFPPRVVEYSKLLVSPEHDSVPLSARTDQRSSGRRLYHNIESASQEDPDLDSNRCFGISSKSRFLPAAVAPSFVGLSSSSGAKPIFLRLGDNTCHRWPSLELDLYILRAKRTVADVVPPPPSLLIRSFIGVARIIKQ
ncbi:hypothetical protein DFS33DRAFT_1278363 [Desarmillaria ectypa]|nr:hypothetical protein DFS33DRAFT_1278363 [Desarmillaria ectypa]